MIKKFDSKKARLKRHARVRNKISGTPEVLRLCVFRSAKHIYAQVIDDVNGVTLASASSLTKDFGENGGNIEVLRKSANWWLRLLLTRALRTLYSTEAVICITAECRLWQKLPVKTV